MLADKNAAFICKSIGGYGMSNFTCEKCGVDILDSPRGYITACEHYPLCVKPNEKERKPAIKAKGRT